MTPSEWLVHNQHALVEDCPIARVTKMACRARIRAFYEMKKAETRLNPNGCVGCRHGITKEVYDQIIFDSWGIEN